MDLKNKTIKELTELLKEKRESLRAFKFGITGSKVRNVKEGRALRKDTARILTEINNKKD